MKEVTAVWAWAEGERLLIQSWRSTDDRWDIDRAEVAYRVVMRALNVREMSGCGHDVTRILSSFVRRIEFSFLNSLGPVATKVVDLRDIYVKIMSRVERCYSPLGLPSAASSKRLLF